LSCEQRVVRARVLATTLHRRVLLLVVERLRDTDQRCDHGMRNATVTGDWHLRRPRIHTVLDIEAGADARAAAVVTCLRDLIDLGDREVGRASDKAGRHGAAAGIDDASAGRHLHRGA
jgi:hypothetical protein